MQKSEVILPAVKNKNTNPKNSNPLSEEQTKITVILKQVFGWTRGCPTKYSFQNDSNHFVTGGKKLTADNTV